MLYRISAIAIFLFISLSASAGVTAGKRVPDIELPSLITGAPVRLSDIEGKIVYIDFWASWCEPCRLSLPALERIRDRYHEDFEVFAINLDEDPEDGRRFLERHPVSYPVVSDALAIYPPLFDIKGMPTSYIIDREGKLRYVHEGYRSGDGEKIERVILHLISE